MKIEGNAWNYGRPNVAILGEKKYLHSEEYNQCNVIKFLFLPIILCKVKKENLFRQKRNNFVLTLKLIFNFILIIFSRPKKASHVFKVSQSWLQNDVKTSFYIFVDIFAVNKREIWRIRKKSWAGFRGWLHTNIDLLINFKLNLITFAKL